jgi:hypothetical protein
MKHPGFGASLALSLCCVSPLTALAQDAPREHLRDRRVLETARVTFRLEAVPSQD